jgi:hypothetical protein
VSETRRSLKCLACGAVAWTDGPVPEACLACGEPWRVAGVAIIEGPGGAPYVLPDGASIVREG